MKVDIGFGVEVEVKKTKTMGVKTIIDNNLPNNIWERKMIRRLLWDLGI